MNGIEQLHDLIVPLDAKLEAFYPQEDDEWFDLKDAKYIKLTSYSDIMLKLELIYSFD